MLSAKKLASKWYVEINSSSLDLLQTCMRKSFYSLHEKLVLIAGHSPALSFGTGIHKALEHWYTLPTELRLPKISDRELAEQICAGHAALTNVLSPVHSVKCFYESAKDALGSLESTDKRSLANGCATLLAYFKHYADDGLEIHKDTQGVPYIEREVEYVLHDSPTLQITYFGTIDMIVRNKNTGIVMVCDHKTTAALGTEFYQRCKPNFQYCGYTLMAEEKLGIDTNLFMINGIQVAKTKKEFARQVVSFDDDDFNELESAVLMRVKHYLEALETGEWPMTCPNPCTMYGGCQYLKLCEVPQSIRQNIIESNWSKNV